ncbi:hypothetical protein QQY24_27845 [Streptomyces sp. TG1A-8]|uniref:hypothetical protein n=1 Tax=Streptomyces sp. TG1A-8 TaxID=3051385 RepID=UPI00265C2852|nr:hypothetical protein [Streptomyces sp. TG1A-8]MDO0929035.1 hypothetical protein [Streptomyces sp. TG1A-8]
MEQIGDKPEEVREHLDEEERSAGDQRPAGDGQPSRGRPGPEEGTRRTADGDEAGTADPADA